MKVGNRDLSGADFRWVDEAEIKSRSLPREAVYVERREYGPFIGTPVRLIDGERELATGADAVWQALQPLDREGGGRPRATSATIERDEIGAINARDRGRAAGHARGRVARSRRRGRRRRGREGRDRARLAELKARYAERGSAARRRSSRRPRGRASCSAAVDGTEKELSTLDIFRAYRANELSFGGRVGVYAGRLWEFLVRRSARVEHRGRHLSRRSSAP